MKKVMFNYADGSFTFNQKNRLKAFIETLFSAEGKHLEALNYVFCSDSYLLGINQTYLQHDTYTDIITFDLSEFKGKQPVVGEIYISTERVAENALTFATSKQDEMLRVIFHGALHLCGYKDKTKSDSILMRQKEAEYIHKFKQ